MVARSCLMGIGSCSPGQRWTSGYTEEVRAILWCSMSGAAHSLVWFVMVRQTGIQNQGVVTPIGAILAAATGVTMRSRGHQGFFSVVTRSRRFSGKVKTVTERARIRLGTYQSNMQGDEFEYGRGRAAPGVGAAASCASAVQRAAAAH